MRGQAHHHIFPYPTEKLAPSSHPFTDPLPAHNGSNYYQRHQQQDSDCKTVKWRTELAGISGVVIVDPVGSDERRHQHADDRY